ncbi:type II secretion system protein [Pseudomonas sp.]|uniref:type II secretion system protein n=1 Tax=Pseudomonas sp. TaxID=306 RepID=UPI00290C7C0D|nr:type II secretion system protein [Pseudomonas sp.]MDU4254442.1 type II secretion system protein [Pseudomonas sp.]
MRAQQGFTLIELMITTVILGALFVAIGPGISSALTMMEAAKRDEVIVNNQKLASGMMAFARNSNGGRLPAPYTGSGVASGLYNPADASAAGLSLSMELRNSGVPVNDINTDGAVIDNVKVYQRVAGLTYTVPLYFTTGTPVVLTYDVGAITQTACALNNACNTGVPGASTALTAANVTTWGPTYPDYGAVVFSTLPEQKNMLQLTVGRLNRLSDRLASEFYTRMRLAAANSTQNFYPLPTNGGAPNLAGMNPVANMGCHNGWYRLSAANVNILTQLGLDQSEYGVTAWGGAIDYCRDYEPTATSSATADTPPHYAALRFNRNISSGAVSTGTVANDVVVTF